MPATRRIIFTIAAEQDQKRIRAWFMQPGAGEIARKRLMRLEASIQALARAPHAHRILLPPATRALVSQGHRVFYDVLPGASGQPHSGDVLILRVYGPGQSSD